MLKKGKYRHFKGGEYEVLFTALDSENLNELVVYKALYDEGKIWVRPLKEFEETVTRDGKTFKRFEYLG